MNPSAKVIIRNSLQIEILREGGEVHVKFLGKSNEREPALFLKPLFREILETAASGKAKILLDFTDLNFMNSSTITPIIQFLEEARGIENHIELRYRKDKFWQEINFSAMRFLATDSSSLKILGI